MVLCRIARIVQASFHFFFICCLTWKLAGWFLLQPTLSFCLMWTKKSVSNSFSTSSPFPSLLFALPTLLPFTYLHYYFSIISLFFFFLSFFTSLSFATSLYVTSVFWQSWTAEWLNEMGLATYSLSTLPNPSSASTLGHTHTHVHTHALLSISDNTVSRTYWSNIEERVPKHTDNKLAICCSQIHVHPQLNLILKLCILNHHPT